MPKITKSMCLFTHSPRPQTPKRCFSVTHRTGKKSIKGAGSPDPSLRQSEENGQRPASSSWSAELLPPADSSFCLFLNPPTHCPTPAKTRGKKKSKIWSLPSRSSPGLMGKGNRKGKPFSVAYLLQAFWTQKNQQTMPQNEANPWCFFPLMAMPRSFMKCRDNVRELRWFRKQRWGSSTSSPPPPPPAHFPYEEGDGQRSPQ